MKRLRGFSLVELLATVAITGLLATVVTTTAGRGIEAANSAKCLGQLRQWGSALQNYVQDSGGFLPRRGQGVQPVWVVDRPEDWFNSLAPYLEMPPYSDLYAANKAPGPGARSIFVCPSAKVTNPYRHFITYGMNMYLSRWDASEATRVAAIPSPSTLAFMADSPGGYASTVPASAAYSVAPRHSGWANVVFVDGHAASFSGDYLGCGSRDTAQPDVRWQTGLAGDFWRPGP